MTEVSTDLLQECYSLEEVRNHLEGLCATILAHADVDVVVGVSGDHEAPNMILQNCGPEDANGAHEIWADMAKGLWYGIAASVLLHDARFVILVREGAVLLARNGARRHYFSWLDKCLASTIKDPHDECDYDRAGEPS